jgi:hypothetical protein
MAATGGAGGPPCAGALIDVDIDANGEGPTMPLTWNCENDPPGLGAYGLIGYLGKGGPQVTMLVGCNAPGDFGFPAGLEMWGELTEPGSTQSGQATFTMSSKQYPETTDVSLTIDEYGAVGGTISGDLSFTLVNANGTPHTFTAAFAVCRYPDLPPPP